MVKIPESVIEQIKSHVDILDIISEVVHLERKGASYKGLCPFHDDKRPSFSVAPTKGVYRCFSCGVGGNAITFIMNYDKINFIEALKKLALRYSIPITWEEGDDPDKASEISQLYELHDQAKTLYHKKLFTAEGKEALQYLHNRGFNDEIIKNFAIGFAPSSWDDLLKNTNRKVYNNNVLELSGLYIERKNEKSGYYDRFRNRVMFPIKNISGRTIAFGGRALDPNDNAKYINSPETKIYNKSEVLFGFDISKGHIRKKNSAIIVEGYTDFLRIFNSGFKNVVAGSGTALTPGHAKIIKRFTNQAYLCYDGDEPGQKAAIQAGFIFLKTGVDVKIINLPETEDPDTFIINNGYEGFATKIESAIPFLDFILDRNKDKLQSPVQKSEFIEKIVREISEIEDFVVRDFIVKNLAERLGINEERVFGQMKHFLDKKKFKQNFNANPENVQEEKTPVISTAADKAESNILLLIIAQKNEIVELVFQHIDSENFNQPELKRILKVLLSRLANHKSIEAQSLYSEQWSDLENKLLTKLLSEVESLEEKKDDIIFTMAIDCMEKILLSPIDNEIKEIRIKLKNISQDNIDEIKLLHDYKIFNQQN